MYTHNSYFSSCPLFSRRPGFQSSSATIMHSASIVHPHNIYRSIPNQVSHARRHASQTTFPTRVRFPSMQREFSRLSMPSRRLVPGSGIVSKLENETDVDAPSRPPKPAATGLNERNAVSDIQGQPVRRPLSDDEKERRMRMEDELKDSKNFFDYLAPRPLRRIFFASGAASCTVAFVVSLAKVIANPSLELAEGGVANVGINLIGLLLFGGLYLWEGQEAEKRVVQRKKTREAQIKLGDREVYVNAEGEKMSRLKPVDDDWIIRRLDRWGQKDLLPQVGPKKGAILQSLVQQRAPTIIAEVGSFTGYSAIKMGQVMPPGCRVVSFETDFKWLMVAKRFVWQAKLGKVIDIRWGDAIRELPNMEAPIDFLFLDGKPWEYLEYLKAAESRLSPGAVIVADNAGVFSKSLGPYLEYVRNSGSYSSKYIESTLEYRDDVKDGLEVSTYSP